MPPDFDGGHRSTTPGELPRRFPVVVGNSLCGNDFVSLRTIFHVAFRPACDPSWWTALRRHATGQPIQARRLHARSRVGRRKRMVPNGSLRWGTLFKHRWHANYVRRVSTLRWRWLHDGWSQFAVGVRTAGCGQICRNISSRWYRSLLRVGIKPIHVDRSRAHEFPLSARPLLT